jgi:hypothetical protein
MVLLCLLRLAEDCLSLTQLGKRTTPLCILRAGRVYRLHNYAEVRAYLEKEPVSIREHQTKPNPVLAAAHGQATLLLGHMFITP